MSDPDRIREREHWQAIAEQLGLAPEPEEPSAPAVSPDSVHSKPEHEPVAAQAGPPVEPAELSEDESPRRGRRGRSTRTVEEAARREEPEKLPTEEPRNKETGVEPVQTAEEKPAAKRGRRRRSARSSPSTERKASEITSGVPASSEIEERDQPAERPKQRGRGRDRQKKTAAVRTSQKAASDEQPGSNVSAPGEEEEIEAEDVRSLSNWNVPSWSELIASLYRPER